MDIIYSVAWLQQNEQKILCVRSKGKGKFYLPGGKIDAGETTQQALIREIAEELNICLIPESIQPAFTIQEKAHGLANALVNMQCFLADYHGHLQPCNEIAEMQWMGKHKLAHCALAAQKAIRLILAEPV